MIPDSIETRILDTLKAEESLDDLTFVRGVLQTIPVGYFPVCEVAIAGERTTQETTGMKFRTYTGLILISSIAPEVFSEPVERVMTAVGYIASRNYGLLVKELFERDVNRNLNDLVGDDWSVVRFMIESDADYGFDNRAQRPNNYENTVTIPFQCETQEAKS